jgi:hypothetical protein
MSARFGRETVEGFGIINRLRILAYSSDAFGTASGMVVIFMGCAIAFDPSLTRGILE